MANQLIEPPIVRLNLVHPFLAELQRRNIDCSATLATFGITPLAIQERQMFVSVPVMYALAESLSARSGDPYFGVHVGERVDPFAYSPLAEAAATAKTLGDFLLRFAMNVNLDTTSINCALESDGKRTTFHWHRVTDGGVCPAHNDGFDIAYLMVILQMTVAGDWNGKEVVIRVCEPKVIPPGYRGTRITGTDTRGASVSFPSGWLLLEPPSKGQAKGGIPDVPESPARGLLNVLDQILAPHLHETDLSAEQVAGLLGVSRRTLARQLQNSGTTLQAQLARLRQRRAERLLRAGELSVSQVGAAVGYPDGAAFARAFRRWTGASPKQYRAQREKKTSW